LLATGVVVAVTVW